MLSDRLSVTLVYCGQTVGLIKMKLGMQVGLGSGHIVLDGDPPPPPKGHSRAIFGPYLLWPNGWMDQDGTWHLGSPRSREFVLDGYPAPSPKRGVGAEPPLQFSAHVCCGHTAGWIKMALGMKVGLGPGHIVLDGDPAALPKRGGAPNFRPTSVVAKRLHGSRCHLVRW